MVILDRFRLYKGTALYNYALLQVLNKNTIPLLNTKIICGASNCPVDSMEDYKVLADMNITYATDVVPNRMVS